MIRRGEEPLSLKNESGASAAAAHYAHRTASIGALSQSQIGLSSHGVYRLPGGTGLLQHTTSSSRILDSGSHVLSKTQESAIPLTTSYHQPSPGHHGTISYGGSQGGNVHVSGGQSSPAQGILHTSNPQGATLLSGGQIPAAHTTMSLSINQVQNQQIVQSPNEPVNLQTHQSLGYHPALAHQQIRHAHSGVGKIHPGTPVATPSPTGSSPAPSTPQPVSLAASAASTAQQQQFQRLKVEDALSYLDQVKYKFGGQPQVYNDFLDIMKEFKSQSIDTPGVIARVSSLFRGHPELIVGFNTFLPPGYKIEVKSSNHMSVSAAGGTMNNLHTTTVVHAPSGIHHISASGAITYPVPQVERPPVERPPMERYVTLPERAAPTPPTITNLTRPPVAPTPPMAIKQPMPSPGMSVTTSQYHSPTPPSSVGPPMPPVVQTPPPSQVSLAQQTTLQGTLSALAQSSGQPVEFNHAISYVNKIKSRFHGQPDIYKQFLEILHTYQKEQKMIKDGIQPPPGSRFLSEQEVYSQVARLFHHQDDLLAEFGQFLPDATSSAAIASAISHRNMLSDQPPAHQKKPQPPVTLVQPPVQSPIVNKPVPVPQSVPPKEPPIQSGTPSAIKTAPKRPLEASPPQGAVPKKPRIMPAASDVIRDITVAEAAKYGALSDFAFFDKVRRALKSNDVYENFLRCLLLFNQELVSRAELLQLVTPFLGKFPELLKWFRDFLGLNDSPTESSVVEDSNGGKIVTSLGPVDVLPNAIAKQEKISTELALEIDYSTCKRLGASYCALPRSHVQPKCSGRTALCREVLNDTWVSFPSWSEDSTFVSSRKTQYEEYIYRCEDERFEMDIVLEANLATIRVLEMVQKKMARMTPEEVARFKLDDCLGGTSSTIHIRAIRRIYGEKANDIVEGLKRNPSVAVPVVLRRLKSKEEEWREAQKGFNKIWRDQNEKYYLKSLDHQGITFKQNDMKLLRTKSLLNEIETLFEERQEQADAGNVGAPGSVPASGPHMILPYPDRSVLDDAAELLIYHAKRASIQKEEKKKIKILVKHTLPDLFMHQRQELSEDERDDDDDEEEGVGRNSPFVSKAGKKNSSVKQPPDPHVKNGKNKTVNGDINGGIKEEKMVNGEVKSEPVSRGSSPVSHGIGTDYTMLMGNSAWYAFMRLHQILCERMSKMKCISAKIASDYKEGKEPPASVTLKMRPQIGLSPPEYYTGLIDMVKSLLDNNMDSSTFEDQAREMFGIHAYHSFTLDKVVINAVRQLQHIVSEETSIQCTELFFNSLKQRHLMPRAVAEAAYQKKVEMLITDDSILKMYIHRDTSQLTIELIDTDSTEVPDKSESRKSRERWQNYVESYSQETSVGLGEFSVVPDCPKVGAKPIFLRRNTRHWRKLKDRIKKEKMEREEEEPEKKMDLMEERPELRGLVVNDNTKCKFSPNCYKLAFVVKSGSYIYRKGSLHRARRSHRRATLNRHDKFNAWHSAWCENHVPNPEPAQNWFLGRFEGCVPNTTKTVVIDEPGQPPYVPYNKYKVHYPVQTVANTS